MATWNSLEYASTQAVPNVLLPASQVLAPIRRAQFTIDPTTAPGVGDTINLCLIPKGAQIVGGVLSWGTNPAGATLSIGLPATALTGNVAVPGRYLNAQAISTAGGGFFGVTNPQNYGDVMTQDTLINATVGGAALPTGSAITGEVDYVLGE